MEKLDARLEYLEARLASIEARLQSLREENARLRAALGAPAHAGSQAAGLDGSPGEALPHQDGRRESPSFRLAVLEAERQDVRSRLRRLIQTL